jgi:two-component system, OmpR family, alkaline phosphatase synthesis response regulator PhoP
MSDCTILVADDETHILNVVSIKLQNAGFTVLTAEDGAEAYAQAVTHRPDLIISDFQMPRLSGLELACKLWRDPMTRDIPIMLLTARGFDIPEQAKSSSNIRCVLAKPFSPRQILTSVNQLLAESAATSAVVSNVSLA